MSEVRWPVGGQIISHSLPGYRTGCAGRGGGPVAEGSAASSASRAGPCARGTGARRLLTSAAFLRLPPTASIALAIGCASAGRTASSIWDGATIRVKLRAFSHRASARWRRDRRQGGQEAAVRLAGEGKRAMLVGYVEAKKRGDNRPAPAQRAAGDAAALHGADTAHPAGMFCPRPAAASSQKGATLPG